MGNIINFHHHKREVKTMCKVLKKIHNKTAEQMLQEYDVYNTLPIDLTKLADNIGISVLPADFTNLEKNLNKQDILGLVVTDGDNAAIYYKQNDTYDSIRFTIAHELAHCCNIDPDCDTPHIEYRLNENEKNDAEKQMDIFAEELLIPFHKLKEVYMSMILPDIKTLAKLFAVPENVMKRRLDYLKISYLDAERQPVFYE